ncbi:MAG TPA: LysR family transcriptional regulator [Syntrophomonadaceae bacterium]|nr:LysR family transcriptional regulator [Syntrophomonadaceae bacterium]
MNFAWLQTFNVIVEEGSLTRAARALHLTQPAVSKQLRALEEYYGTPLFYRTTREIELTEAGKIVYQYSQKALDLIGKSRNEVQSLARIIQGELSLGASTIPGEYILPGFLGLFQQRYPGVRVKLEIGDSKAVAQKVAEGKLELGITGALIKGRNLRYELFFRDELVVVVPKGHRFAGRGSVTLEEFIAEPHVAREKGSGTRIAIENRLMELGVSPSALNISLELGSTEAVLNAVARGVGISLVSGYAARPRARVGELACLKIDGVPFERGLYFVTRKKPEPRTILRVFIDFLKEQRDSDHAGNDL